uniref:FACT complex subunit SSRP1 n=1 Tax=Chlamydomonas leiostraca TaxID=1034604 RepID=A0A7S0WQ82_9CHLO|mmetsp:Transcript_23205/g.59271  ORF Transcript_23205/g.59271 Transcript_23205/m.59271 type:complete len:691 (+) Transcript_23205:174-2246(+)|eukprot:CAMPEP_0202860302 /NCGR_PEP_ID=MMETSP1391-20130828/2063_1 /ASSEMBLY_ACC=CAM_ASM_000867 /TAXON_ID=1034604 /ORGANISM="Chlamydomonas leiostraca, Strain SAG 11-49" /LENGTH=690 /DNA_ID=CAMNT_0049539455 /DNA_START=163 /DNA_END=2235 /DNA_ORIENTATION=+
MATDVAAVHSFGSIFLGQRGGVSQGALRINGSGFAWKRNSGGKAIEIKKDDIENLYWTKATRGCQLGVQVRDGITMNFIGFREKDHEPLNTFCKQQFGKDIHDQPMATSGRNWGGVQIAGKSLKFVVDGRVAFEVPLPDVAQAQQQKDDIMLEFHVDDTAADEREDALAEMAFHVPAGHPHYSGGEAGEEPAAKVLLDAVLVHTDTGAASTDDPTATFSDVHVLAPRGRFEVEMFLGHLTLGGQTQDFKIRYASIQRIFILPKSATPHTLVVVSLDPPIRKGQTYYTHILCQFPSEEEASIELDITPETLAAKNEKCGGKLEASMSGPVFEVFARTLRGLSGAKITRPGGFKNAAQDGFAVRCSYKADDGYLYPLDRAFFYVHKPPMLIPFDEVDSVELTRLGGGAVSSKTFDLVVRTKNNAEHQFRGIQRSEWQVLLDFFLAKKLRVERLREAQAGPSAPGRPAIGDFGDLDDDPGLRRVGLGGDMLDTDEDDEDFQAGAEGSEEESSDGDLDEGGSDDDAEMVPEEGIEVGDVLDKGKAKGKKDKKRKEPDEEADEDEEDEEEEEKPKKKKEKKPKKDKAGGDDGEEGGPKKRGRKKKDPNAPKGAISAFMYFSNALRDKVKEENPGIKFGEVGKLMGERWKAATAEDKAPYEAMAREDKARYAKAMAAYKAGGGGGGGDDDEGGGDE